MLSIQKWGRTHWSISGDLWEKLHSNIGEKLSVSDQVRSQILGKVRKMIPVKDQLLGQIWDQNQMIFHILGHLSTSKHILVILICNVSEAFTFSGTCGLMSLRIHEWVLNADLRWKPTSVNTIFSDLKPRFSCKSTSVNVYHLHQLIPTPIFPLHPKICATEQI